MMRGKEPIVRAPPCCPSRPTHVCLPVFAQLAVDGVPKITPYIALASTGLKIVKALYPKWQSVICSLYGTWRVESESCWISRGRWRSSRSNGDFVFRNLPRSNRSRRLRVNKDSTRRAPVSELRPSQLLMIEIQVIRKGPDEHSLWCVGGGQAN